MGLKVPHDNKVECVAKTSITTGATKEVVDCCGNDREYKRNAVQQSHVRSHKRHLITFPFFTIHSSTEILVRDAIVFVIIYVIIYVIVRNHS